jgi:hypothetical protein
MHRIAWWVFAFAACGGSKGSNTDAGPCPDQQGAYKVALTGQGCGDLSASAALCITQSACAITLASSGSGMNGTAMLGMDGSFTGAAITEGTGNRTGCTGTWSAGASSLTVDCGGVGTSQSCDATLTRTSSSCP